MRIEPNFESREMAPHPFEMPQTPDPSAMTKQQGAEEEILMATHWDELDARYKMDPGYDPDPAFGEPHPHDPDFKGPIRQRSCTNIVFLLLLILGIVAWVALCITAAKHGNVWRVLYPSDSAGNVCGVGNFADRPYLFFFDIAKCKPKFEEDEWIPTTRCRTPQVCVSSCPSKTFSAYAHRTEPDNADEVKKHMRCRYDADLKGMSIRDLVDGGYCASYYVASSQVAGRCVPLGTNFTDEFLHSAVKVGEQGDLDQAAAAKIQKKMTKILNARNYAERLLLDLKNTWPFIFGFLIAAMIVALLWIVLMRYAAGLMVWLGLLGVTALFIAVTAFTWMKWSTLKGVDGAEGSVFSFSRKISFYTGKRQTWLILGIVSSIILFILLLVLLTLRTRIRIAIALIKEAAKAISHMPTALVFPVFPYLVQLTIVIVTSVVFLYLTSLSYSESGGIDMSTYNGSATTTTSNSGHSATEVYEQCIKDMGGPSTFANRTCHVTQQAVAHYTGWLHCYNIFMCFWLLWFIVGYNQMVQAGAVASYYWVRDKREIPTATVLSSMWMVTRYHLGSLAFGSLIIAIVSAIRAVLEYIDRKLREYDNEVTKFLLCCCRCFCWCLENFLRFVNKNAYIMVAIYGEGFCASARQAFNLLMRNVVRVVVIDKVTDFLLLCSKLVVVGCTSFFAYYVFSGSNEFFNRHVPELYYPLFPVAIVAVGAMCIATCFFNVYDMAVDTLFLCFLEDCERNDGSREKPYFMPKELMLILKKNNGAGKAQ